MLEKEVLNKFSRKANQAYNVFCVWIYSNNQFAKYQQKFNEAAKWGFYSSDEECIKKQLSI